MSFLLTQQTRNVRIVTLALTCGHDLIEQVLNCFVMAGYMVCEDELNYTLAFEVIGERANNFAGMWTHTVLRRR